jgi:hypothetical protein
MELNTKKLFTPTMKITHKTRIKVNHKSKPKYLHPKSMSSSKFKTKVNSENVESKITMKAFPLNINPFYRENGSIVNKRIPKGRNIQNKKSIQLNYIKTNNLYDESYMNKLLATNESDANIIENGFNKENKCLNVKESILKCNINPNNKKRNIKSSAFNDKRNNKLDSEQKNIINNYLDIKSDKNNKMIKKNVKINLIPIEKYKENNILFKKEAKKKRTNIITDEKIENKSIFDINNIDKSDVDSIFETYTNKSLESSFLGSSTDDIFYKEFIKGKIII